MNPSVPRTGVRDGTLRTAMPTAAVILVAVYAAGLVLLSLGRTPADDAAGYLLDGRRLTLPSLVATLVTTWYGGILGIGEYGWSYGVSTWVVFALPYYLAAGVLALALAGRMRRTDAVSLPDLLARSYSPATARAGAVGVLAYATPVAYLVMLTILLEGLTGWPRPAAAAVGVAFSAAYVGASGFRAVVRTDVLQMVLMYGGFALLFVAALDQVGGPAALWSALPESHRSWDGGAGWQAVVVWYFIALQTVVDPSFAQRIFAARTPGTARAGVMVSIAFWGIFDLMSVGSVLCARVLLPDLTNPLAAYQQLAPAVLPALAASVVILALVATVMSTLDSYLFLAAATLAHDLSPAPDAATARRRVRPLLLVVAAVTWAASLWFSSAVAVWHHVGSVVTSALLLPVVAVFLPQHLRPSAGGALLMMVTAAAVAGSWLVAGGPEGWPLGVEPMFPALGAAAILWGADVVRSRVRP